MKYPILLATVSSLMLCGIGYAQTVPDFTPNATINVGVDEDGNPTDDFGAEISNLDLEINDLKEGSGLRSVVEDGQDALAALAGITDTPVMVDDHSQPIADADGNMPINSEWVPTYAQTAVMVDDHDRPINDADGNIPGTPDWTPTFAQKEKEIDDLTKPIADSRNRPPGHPDWVPTFEQKVEMEDDLTQPIADEDGNSPFNEDWDPTYVQIPQMVKVPVEDADGELPTLPDGSPNTDWTPTYVDKPVLSGGTIEKTAAEISRTIEQSDANTQSISDLTTETDANTQSISDLTSDVADNQQGIIDANARIDLANQAFDDFKVAVGDIDTTESLVATVGANTAELTVHDGRITVNETAIADHEDRITDNSTAIADHEIRITDNSDAIADHEGRITDNEQGILDNLSLIGTVQDLAEGNEKEIEKNAAAIVSNANRINTLEEDVDSLKSGVAMAIAIANAPIVSNGVNKFSLSGGVGYYEDKFALSLKSAFMPTDSIAITASVASDLSENYAFGAGVGIGF